MKECLDLYRTFFIIGSITFGGGYAILPILIREIVEKRQWIGENEMLDYFAVSQCTPGIICVNVSTFMGYRRQGFWGALAATLGVITPSLIIITVVAAVLSNFADIPWVQHAFAGIRIAVSALIASTVWNLARKNVKTWLKAVIAITAFAAVGLLHVSPIYVTLAFAVFGAFFFGRRQPA
jgi:chromate transporter